jgi:hypothetical protein
MAGGLPSRMRANREAQGDECRPFIPSSGRTSKDLEGASYWSPGAHCVGYFHPPTHRREAMPRQPSQSADYLGSNAVADQAPRQSCAAILAENRIIIQGLGMHCPFAFPLVRIHDKCSETHNFEVFSMIDNPANMSARRSSCTTREIPLTGFQA